MKLLLKMIGRIAAILDCLAWKLKDLEHRFYNVSDWDNEAEFPSGETGKRGEYGALEFAAEERQYSGL